MICDCDCITILREELAEALREEMRKTIEALYPESVLEDETVGTAAAVECPVEKNRRRGQIICERLPPAHGPCVCFQHRRQCREACPGSNQFAAQLLYLLPNGNVCRVVGRRHADVLSGLTANPASPPREPTCGSI